MPFRIRVKKRKHFRLKLFFKKNNYSTVQYSNSSHTFTKKTIYLLDNAVVAVAVAVAVVISKSFRGPSSAAFADAESGEVTTRMFIGASLIAACTESRIVSIQDTDISVSLRSHMFIDCWFFGFLILMRGWRVCDMFAFRILGA